MDNTFKVKNKPNITLLTTTEELISRYMIKSKFIIANIDPRSLTSPKRIYHATKIKVENIDSTEKFTSDITKFDIRITKLPARNTERYVNSQIADYLKRKKYETIKPKTMNKTVVCKEEVSAFNILPQIRREQRRNTKLNSAKLKRIRAQIVLRNDTERKRIRKTTIRRIFVFFIFMHRTSHWIKNFKKLMTVEKLC